MKTQRIIKFRVWDEKYKYWVKNSFLLYPEDEIKIQGRILTQFTGLLDKNNKEIYEGDIVKFFASNGFGQPMESWGDIILDEYYWKVNNIHYKWPNPPSNDFDSVRFYRNWNRKIIGNIFENPELLNEKI